jgi:hypothetical protein
LIKNGNIPPLLPLEILVAIEIMVSFARKSKEIREKDKFMMKKFLSHRCLAGSIRSGYYDHLRIM